MRAGDEEDCGLREPEGAGEEESDSGNQTAGKRSRRILALLWCAVGWPTSENAKRQADQ